MTILREAQGKQYLFVLTFCLNSSSMQFYNFFCNSKSQTGPTCFGISGRINSVELLKDF